MNTSKLRNGAGITSRDFIYQGLHTLQHSWAGDDTHRNTAAGSVKSVEASKAWRGAGVGNRGWQLMLHFEHTIFSLPSSAHANVSPKCFENYPNLIENYN